VNRNDGVAGVVLTVEERVLLESLQLTLQRPDGLLDRCLL
jgi:hypothetical protein